VKGSIERRHIGEIAQLERRPVNVDLSHEYHEIGIRSFGRGVFHKEPVSGAALGAKRVFRIKPGDLLLNNVFAWEGAIAVADEEQEGRIGSHRFMTYVVDRNLADPHYLLYYLLSESGLELIRRASPGSAGRNRTLGIEAFESLEIPLPPIDVQHEIAASVGGLIANSRSLGELTVRNSPSLLMSALPSLTQNIFDGSRAGRTPVADLVDFISDTIHPGDDLGEASVFVGLQHVESHSGRRIGGISLGQEQGRKFRFRPGDVVYGYLRPYLNKVWVADCHGLCSVDQYVLRPKPNVRPGLLAHGLRTRSTLDEAIRLTHSLQLPRLRSSLLAAIEIPVSARQPAAIERRLDNLVRQVCEVVDLRRRQVEVVKAYEPAVLNDAFAAIA
jgi:type I restriction enzyme S subunit